MQTSYFFVVGQKSQQDLNSPGAAAATLYLVSEHAHRTLDTATHQCCCVHKTLPALWHVIKKRKISSSLDTTMTNGDELVLTELTDWSPCSVSGSSVSEYMSSISIATQTQKVIGTCQLFYIFGYYFL